MYIKVFVLFWIDFLQQAKTLALFSYVWDIQNTKLGALNRWGTLEKLEAGNEIFDQIKRHLYMKEENVVFPWICVFSTFAKKQLIIAVVVYWLCIGGVLFYSIGPISGFMPIPWWFCCYGSVVKFVIFPILLQSWSNLQDCLIYSESFVLPCEFKNSFLFLWNTIFYWLPLICLLLLVMRRF